MNRLTTENTMVQLVYSRLAKGLRWLFGAQLHYINGADTLPAPLSRQEEDQAFGIYPQYLVH